MKLILAAITAAAFLWLAAIATIAAIVAVPVVKRFPSLTI